MPRSGALPQLELVLEQSGPGAGPLDTERIEFVDLNHDGVPGHPIGSVLACQARSPRDPRQTFVVSLPGRRPALVRNHPAMKNLFERRCRRLYGWQKNLLILDPLDPRHQCGVRRTWPSIDGIIDIKEGDSPDHAGRPRRAGILVWRTNLTAVDATGDDEINLAGFPTSPRPRPPRSRSPSSTSPQQRAGAPARSNFQLIDHPNPAAMLGLKPASGAASSSPCRVTTAVVCRDWPE